jgi:hypothetical protein
VDQRLKALPHTTTPICACSCSTDQDLSCQFPFPKFDVLAWPVPARQRGSCCTKFENLFETFAETTWCLNIRLPQPGQMHSRRIRPLHVVKKIRLNTMAHALRASRAAWRAVWSIDAFNPGSSTISRPAFKPYRSHNG